MDASLILSTDQFTRQVRGTVPCKAAVPSAPQDLCYQRTSQSYLGIQSLGTPSTTEGTQHSYPTLKHSCSRQMEASVWEEKCVVQNDSVSKGKDCEVEKVQAWDISGCGRATRRDDCSKALL